MFELDDRSIFGWTASTSQSTLSLTPPLQTGFPDGHILPNNKKGKQSPKGTPHADHGWHAIKYLKQLEFEGQSFGEGGKKTKYKTHKTSESTGS